MPCMGNNTSGCDIGTIYVIGDVNTLAEVFIGLSTIFGSNEWTGGGAGLGANMALAMMIALMVTGFKAIVSQKIELHFMLVSVIIFNVFFVPTMPLQVVDYSSGRNSGTIMGVPIGIGMIGHATGSLSYYLTDEIAENFSGLDGNGNYSTPFKDGFLDPLVQMLMLRKTTFATMDSRINSTLLAYWKNCVSPSEDSGQFGYEQFENSPEPIDYLFSQANINNHLTMVYNDQNPEGVATTCHEVIQEMQARFNSLTEDEKSRAIQGALYERNGSGEIRDFETYERSINAILGYGADAQEFMIRSMMANYVSIAKMFDSHHSDDAKAYAAMVTESVEKERIDSAAEATLFLNFMQPMLSVLMFVFYASSPIMAIIILAVPSSGMQKAGMYLLFGVWVHSWMPFAAIVNSYIQNSITHAISDGNGIIDSSFSLNQLPGVYNMVANKLSAASNIMTAVSMVSLALIAGSPFAIAQLGNRFSNNNKVNTAMASPDIARVEPVAKQAAQRAIGVGDQAMPSSVTASESLIGASKNVSFSNTRTMQATRAQEAVDSAAKSYEANVSSAVRAGRTAVASQMGGEGSSAFKSFNSSAEFKSVEKSLKSKNFSDSEVSEVMDSLQRAQSVTASGGGSLGSLLKAAKSAVGMSASTTDIDTSQSSGGRRVLEGLNFLQSKEGQNAVGENLVNQYSQKLEQSTNGREDLQSQKESIASAKDDFREAKTFQEKLSKVHGSQSTEGTSFSGNSAQIIQDASRNAGFGALSDHYLNDGGYGEFKSFVDGLNGNNYGGSGVDTTARRLTKALEGAADMPSMSNKQVGHLLGMSDQEIESEQGEARIMSARMQSAKFMNSVGSVASNNALKGGAKINDVEPNVSSGVSRGKEQSEGWSGEINSKAAGVRSKANQTQALAEARVDGFSGKVSAISDATPSNVSQRDSVNYVKNRNALGASAGQLADRINSQASSSKTSLVDKITKTSGEQNAGLEAAYQNMYTGGESEWEFQGTNPSHSNNGWVKKESASVVSREGAVQMANAVYKSATENHGRGAGVSSSNANVNPQLESIQNLVSSGAIGRTDAGYIILSAELETKGARDASVQNLGNYMESFYPNKAESFLMERSQADGIEYKSMNQYINSQARANNEKLTEVGAKTLFDVKNYEDRTPEKMSPSFGAVMDSNFKGK